MTANRPLAHTFFAGLILAALAAGCAAGGGRSALPGAPAAADQGAKHRQRVGAVLYVHIPRKPRGHGRDPRYVSPNTRSLTLGVQYVTASPWPSMSPQTLVVNTPKPCVIPTGAGGYTCTFNVKAFLGKNIFTFNEYASKHPKPQDTPLGTLTSGVTKVSAGDPALSFTLHGVVHSVQLGVPNPESTFDPASAHTEPIPIGVATTFPLEIDPEDASGASIATDAFSAPVTIELTPATAGVSLALDKQCTGDTATKTKVTLNCAADLSRVSVAYDGTAASSGTGYIDRATIVASPQFASPAPPSAAVALTSNVVSSRIVPAPSFTTNPYVEMSNLALNPVTGKFVFAAEYNGGHPVLVQFDPATQSSTSVSIGFEVDSLAFDASGNIWTDDYGNSQVHCFTSITAAPSTTYVSGYATPMPDVRIAVDGSQNVWYSGLAGNNYPAAGFFGASCAGVTDQAAQFDYGTNFETPYGIALAAPSAGSPGVWIPAGGFDARLFTMHTSDTASPPPVATWPIDQLPSGIVNDPSYNLYTGTYVEYPSNSPGLINKIAAGSSTISTLMTLQPLTEPYSIAQYSGSHATAQSLVVADDFYGGAIVVSPVAAATEPLLLNLPQGTYCGPVGYDKKGAAWAVCGQPDGTIVAFRLAITSTWGAEPNALFYTSGSFNSVVTVAETSGTDNSPFTVTNNTNPSVIALGTPWPATPAFPHAIPIVVQATGSTTLSIVDKHGRKQQLTITVAPSGLVITGAAPPAAPPTLSRKAHRRLTSLAGTKRRAVNL